MYAIVLLRTWVSLFFGIALGITSRDSPKPDFPISQCIKNLGFALDSFGSIVTHSLQKDLLFFGSEQLAVFWKRHDEKEREETCDNADKSFDDEDPVEKVNGVSETGIQSPLPSPTFISSNAVHLRQKSGKKLRHLLANISDMAMRDYTDAIKCSSEDRRAEKDRISLQEFVSLVVRSDQEGATGNESGLKHSEKQSTCNKASPTLSQALTDHDDTCQTKLLAISRS